MSVLSYGRGVCGRFTHLYTWKQLHRLLALTTPPLEFKERYNVAPMQDAPVARVTEDGGRGVSMLRWGLVPSWAKDAKIGNSLINARGETIATKPAFRSAFKRRRCIVPVSGFYEWQKVDEENSDLFGRSAGTSKRASKQLYYITSADGEPLLLAGLWESWRDPSDETAGEGHALETFTIITTTANEMVAKLHDRMPVILDQADAARWLDCSSGDGGAVVDLLRPYPAELMLCRRVSTRVNSPKSDDESCIKPLD